MPDINIPQPVGWVNVYQHLNIPVGTVLRLQNKDTQQLLVREQASAPAANDVSGPICVYGDQYLVTQKPTQGCWIRGRVGPTTGIGIICNVQVEP